METVSIEGQSNLQRDLHSKALLNTNKNELSRYMQQKSILDRNKNLAEEVAVLQQDMNEIKQLLRTLLDL